MAETLSQIIENTRRLKHLTIAELTDAAGISEATYNRMRHDQADLKVVALMALLDKLRLQVADIAPTLTATYFVCQRWQARIEQTVIAVVCRDQPRPALVTLQHELAEACHDHPALTMLQLYLQLMQAKLDDRQSRAQVLARQLYDQLARCAQWTHWKYQLSLPTLNYLDWTELQCFYNDHLAHVSVSMDEALINDEYLAMLANALAHKNVTMIETVIQWCRRRKLTATNLTFALYRRFLTILECRLGCHAAAADQQWQDLQALAARLWQAAPNAPLAVMQQLWQLAADVQGTTAVKLRPCQAVPVAEGTTIVDWVRNWRQAKHVPADQLRQALFISKAAYYRQFAADNNLKANEFFVVLDNLRLEVDDLVRRSDCLGLNVSVTQSRLQHDVAALAAGQAPVRSLAAWQTQLQTCFQRTGNVGYCQLREWLAVVQAQQAGDDAAAVKAAVTLYQELLDYEGWNAFEYSLVITILPWLPFAQGQFLFGHYVDTARNTPTSLTVTTPQVLDQLYLGLLQSALAGGDIQDVRLALKWMAERRLPNQAGTFRLWQRLADCLLAEPPAATAFECLLADVKVIGDTQTVDWCHELQQVWRQAKQVLACAQAK